MTTAAVSMMRDEADVAEWTVRNMCDQVDFVIVADNRSVDGTRDVLERLMREGLPLVVLDDPEPAYLQSQKMTDLAWQAFDRFGARWVVPFDADELWYSPFGRIGDVLEAMPATAGSATAELYDHVATAEDPAGEERLHLRFPWRRVVPAPLPKAAARMTSGTLIAMGNHSVWVKGWPAAEVPGQLVVRHYPYRSVEQIIRKVRNGAEAYEAAGDRVPGDAGAHWRGWGRMSDEAIEALFRTWYWREAPRAELVTPDGGTAPALLLDPAPVG